MSSEKLVYDLAVEVVTGETKKTKFVPQVNSTGITFMQGKQRLVKVVKTKRNLKLEINLKLSAPMLKKLKELETGEITEISKALAKQKHLGTMKYLYKDTNEKMVSEIIKDLLKNYK